MQGCRRAKSTACGRGPAKFQDHRWARALTGEKKHHHCDKIKTPLQGLPLLGTRGEISADFTVIRQVGCAQSADQM